MGKYAWERPPPLEASRSIYFSLHRKILDRARSNENNTNKHSLSISSNFPVWKMVTRCEKSFFVITSGTWAKDRKFRKLEISWQQRSKLFHPDYVITGECNLIRRYSWFGPVPFQYTLCTGEKLNPSSALRGGETGETYFLNVSRVLSFEIMILPNRLSLVVNTYCLFVKTSLAEENFNDLYLNLDALNIESRKNSNFLFFINMYRLYCYL